MGFHDIYNYVSLVGKGLKRVKPGNDAIYSTPTGELCTGARYIVPTVVLLAK